MGVTTIVAVQNGESKPKHKRKRRKRSRTKSLSTQPTTNDDDEPNNDAKENESDIHNVKLKSLSIVDKGTPNQQQEDDEHEENDHAMNGNGVTDKINGTDTDDNVIVID